jgi:hypothetical protein
LLQSYEEFKATKKGCPDQDSPCADRKKNKQRISANHNCPNQARDMIIMLRMTIKALVARRWILRRNI